MNQGNGYFPLMMVSLSDTQAKQVPVLGDHCRIKTQEAATVLQMQSALEGTWEAVTCLAIGKDADIVTIHDAGHYRLHITEDSFLTAAWFVYGVIAEGAALRLC